MTIKLDIGTEDYGMNSLKVNPMHKRNQTEIANVVVPENY